MPHTIKGVIVTIDGVAASGKSSVASGVAQRLGAPYLSSGLLYRAATYLALQAGLISDDSLNPETLSATLLAELERCPVRLEPLATGNLVYCSGHDITQALHTAQIDAGVSAVARLGALRGWVNAQLRLTAPPFVAEGRDMGSAVFPQAQHKFFLVASARVRAQRRVQERLQDLSAVEAALIERDQRDQQQSAPAPDALTIDTGHLTLQEVIDTVLSHIQVKA